MYFNFKHTCIANNPCKLGAMLSKNLIPVANYLHKAIHLKLVRLPLTSYQHKVHNTSPTNFQHTANTLKSDHLVL